MNRLPATVALLGAAVAAACASRPQDPVVHDVRGRLVRTLLDESLPAGPGRVLWDGCDGAGRDVASGTYFVRLVAGGESRVQSVALIR